MNQLSSKCGNEFILYFNSRNFALHRTMFVYLAGNSKCAQEYTGGAPPPSHTYVIIILLYYGEQSIKITPSLRSTVVCVK